MREERQPRDIYTRRQTDRQTGNKRGRPEQKKDDKLADMMIKEEKKDSK